ncbi:MAG: hypothetical protein RMJ56_06555 [Gemmataceae bacterium]|nr:hypothetical protein [Gemmata sp.]MDW8197251.1 hypothetical protein [Gemmataceae bacterium]
MRRKWHQLLTTSPIGPDEFAPLGRDAPGGVVLPMTAVVLPMATYLYDRW